MRGPASVPTIAMQVVCFSLVTFLLTANAYKFTTVESSLVGSPEYSAYVRMVIRFFNHPYSDFSDSLEEQQIFEDSIAAVCSYRRDSIQISSYFLQSAFSDIDHEYKSSDEMHFINLESFVKKVRWQRFKDL